MPFGQVVVGSPGAGKTTYCNGVHQLLTALGRKVAVVNLDPANDFLPYECAVDIGGLIRLDEIMDETELGPNGSFMYAMEYLVSNVDWLLDKLAALPTDTYVIFDCPGQVELYTHHNAVRSVLGHLAKSGWRLAAVHLIDAQVCTQPAVYVAACLLSLSVMLQLELPHVNVLSKVDLLASYGPLPFELEYFTELQDLSYLQKHLDAALPKSFHRLNGRLCELIEDFGLVAFQPLNIQDKESVWSVVKLVDKANGLVFGGLTGGNQNIVQAAERIDDDWDLP